MIQGYIAGKVYHDMADAWRRRYPNRRHRAMPANFHQRGRHELSLAGMSPSKRDDGSVAIETGPHGFDLDFSLLRGAPLVTISGTQNYDGMHYLDSASSSQRLVFNLPFVDEVFQEDAVVFANWERPVHFEFFEACGTGSFSQEMGARIHGGGSRTIAQKTFRLYARNSYSPPGFVDYRLFPAYDQKRFKRFLLRHSTERTGLNDVLGQLFMQQAAPAMDIQRYRPVIVYVNGMFWGWYSIRDRYDRWYFATKYDVSPENIAIIQGWNNVRGGTDADLVDYQKLMRFVRRKDLSHAYRYRQIEEMMDIDLHLAWLATGIYLNYQDWGWKHTQYWRYTGGPSREDARSSALDGRWRVMPLDLDGVFGQKGDGMPADFNFLQVVASDEDFLLAGLLQNETFRFRFINFLADLMNSVFREEIATAFVQGLLDELPEELLVANIARWGHLEDYAEWLDLAGEIEAFLRARPTYMRQHIKEFFELEGFYHVSVTATPKKGYVRINSLPVFEDAAGVDVPKVWDGIYFHGVPIEIEAIPREGYRFAGWSGMEGDDVLVVSPMEDVKFVALFSPLE